MYDVASQGWPHHTLVINIAQVLYNVFECHFFCSKLNSLVQMSSFIRNSDCGILSGSDDRMSRRVEPLGSFSMANCFSGFKLRFLSGYI